MSSIFIWKFGRPLLQVRSFTFSIPRQLRYWLADVSVVLLDGANQKPIFSLRTLTRALEYVQLTVRDYGFPRALYALLPQIAYYSCEWFLGIFYFSSNAG